MLKRGQLIDWQDFPYALRRITDSFSEFDGVPNDCWLEYQWDNNPNNHTRWVIQNYMIDNLGVDAEKNYHGRRITFDLEKLVGCKLYWGIFDS